MTDDPYAHLAGRFVAHYDTLRGALRHALVAAQLDEHLDGRGPLDIVDVGGGAGHQAIRLARRGHRVTLVDPSQEMLQRARTSTAAERDAVRARIRMIQARAEEAATILEGRTFDVVLCHAVLPYVDDVSVVIGSLAALARPGALLSLLYKNADALAMRPALEGRWSDALHAFDAAGDVGGLGVHTRAQRRVDVVRWADGAGFVPRAWYGIRVMSDHLGDARPDALEEVLSVESRAARLDPYRAVGRLLHDLYDHSPPPGR